MVESIPFEVSRERFGTLESIMTELFHETVRVTVLASLSGSIRSIPTDADFRRMGYDPRRKSFPPGHVVKQATVDRVAGHRPTGAGNRRSRVIGGWTTGHMVDGQGM